MSKHLPEKYVQHLTACVLDIHTPCSADPVAAHQAQATAVLAAAAVAACLVAQHTDALLECLPLDLFGANLLRLLGGGVFLCVVPQRNVACRNMGEWCGWKEGRQL